MKIKESSTLLSSIPLSKQYNNVQANLNAREINVLEKSECKQIKPMLGKTSIAKNICRQDCTLRQ
jgi:hypothetical protein